MKDFIIKRRFWILTAAESITIGFSVIVTSLIFNGQLPSIFLRVQGIPVSILLFVLGLATLATLKKVRLWLVVSLAVLWSYMGVGFILELCNPDSQYYLVPLFFGLLCLHIVLRIVLEAYYSNPNEFKSGEE